MMLSQEKSGERRGRPPKELPLDSDWATPVKPYRILVADDHAVVRRGLRVLLESQAGLEVCCEAATGVETLDYVKKEKPDLVILDLTMPEMNGLEVARAIRQESPKTDILVLSMHFSEEIAREVLRSGALGYVLKSDADAELLAAVARVRTGQPFFTSKLAITMAQNFMEAPAVAPAGTENGPAGSPHSPLTQRELEVVRLLACGNSNKQVAATLKVSTRTVESHRNHIMHKMRFTSFSELIRFAVRNNLVDP
jgi:DNA-binding NarL/FixJ family response regulator